MPQPIHTSPGPTQVEAVSAKKVKEGGGVGSFEAKFKQPGTKSVQVWERKCASALKSNGWEGEWGEKMA